MPVAASLHSALTEARQQLSLRQNYTIRAVIHLTAAEDAVEVLASEAAKHIPQLLSNGQVGPGIYRCRCCILIWLLTSPII